MPKLKGSERGVFHIQNCKVNNASVSTILNVTNWKYQEVHYPITPQHILESILAFHAGH